MAMFAISSAMDPTFFTLAIVTVAVRPLDDTSSTFSIVVPMMTVSSFSLFKKVQSDHKGSENDQRNELHCQWVLSKCPLFRSSRLFAPKWNDQWSMVPFSFKKPLFLPVIVKLKVQLERAGCLSDFLKKIWGQSWLFFHILTPNLCFTHSSIKYSFL